MVIKQGDLYWIDLEDPIGSEAGYRRPHVVVQGNAFNESRIKTVIVCPLTSNLQRAAIPGNVLLKQGEAGLIKDSVVNVAQIFTANKLELIEKIGEVSPRKLRQILQGIQIVMGIQELD